MTQRCSLWVRVSKDEQETLPVGKRNVAVEHVRVHVSWWTDEPDMPGSYDDLTAAYDRREITREQYRTLVEAAADSIRAERQS